MLPKSVNISVYYINTSEIPGELSGVNMISAQVKITCYFTRENILLFSQVKDSHCYGYLIP